MVPTAKPRDTSGPEEGGVPTAEDTSGLEVCGVLMVGSRDSG